MKKVLMIAVLGIAMMSCNNGANDGDAKTDTTTMNPDTNRNKDTSNHINRSDGTIFPDSGRTDSGRR